MPDGDGHEYEELEMGWVQAECVGAQFGRCGRGMWVRRLELVVPVESVCRKHDAYGYIFRNENDYPHLLRALSNHYLGCKSPNRCKCYFRTKDRAQVLLLALLPQTPRGLCNLSAGGGGKGEKRNITQGGFMLMIISPLCQSASSLLLSTTPSLSPGLLQGVAAATSQNPRSLSLTP